jgi:isopentenyl-diphosphate delta-isomerase type 1
MAEIEEILEVVDGGNRPVGLASRGSIHRYGLQHRSVHIFIFDGQGRLYLQLRHASKDQYPGHWDTSAAGHVSVGEDYAAAARRELAEELALETDLTWVAQVPASVDTGWEHVALFLGQTEARPCPNPAEIQQGRFFTAAEMEELLADPEAAVTPALRRLYRLWQAVGGG